MGFAIPAFPQTVNKRGWGPAFSNSLFENNAEFALGMSLSTEQLRAQLKLHAEAAIAETADENLKSALQAWLAEGDSEEKTVEVSDRVRDALAANTETGAEVAYIRKHTDTLTKKSIWMYGGDGWAYDIGFGGLDHVLASGANVNVLVVDTEVYSNTGGQASKATPIGAAAQFAAAGKTTPKKDLGMMLATYGYIYVAHVSLGANPEHLIKCLKEAAAYDGPSIVIAYAPCINHYNPELAKEGKNPFLLDSKEPNGKLREYMMGENRFAGLVRTFPEIAEKLFAEAEEHCASRYAGYQKMANDPSYEK